MGINDIPILGNHWPLTIDQVIHQIPSYLGNDWTAHINPKPNLTSQFNVSKDTEFLKL